MAASGRRSCTVPLGEEVAAAWRFLDAAPGAEPATAVIEMAAASGLELVGGAAGNDPMAASTRGTGELIEAALDEGARRIIVGLGGSATTDGGVGALEVIADDVRLRSTELLVACDVTTTFVFAAEVFGPQKGATPAMVGLLGRRLDALAEHYLDRFGVDVRQIPGSGAAGGLGGGLAVLGAKTALGLRTGRRPPRARSSDRTSRPRHHRRRSTGRDVVYRQGRRIASRPRRRAGDIACVVGEATPEALALAGEMTVLSLSDRYGGEKARSDTEALIEATCAEFLASWSAEPMSSAGHARAEELASAGRGDHRLPLSCRRSAPSGRRPPGPLAPGSAHSSRSAPTSGARRCFSRPASSRRVRRRCSTASTTTTAQRRCRPAGPTTTRAWSTRATGKMDSLARWRRRIEECGADDVVIGVVGRSEIVAANWTTPLSFVFIDGGHGAEVEWADYRGWSAKIAPGGLLAIHDVFPDPADGGRPPYECYLDALDSGRFVEDTGYAAESLRVLVATGAGASKAGAASPKSSLATPPANTSAAISTAASE